MREKTRTHHIKDTKIKKVVHSIVVNVQALFKEQKKAMKIMIEFKIRENPMNKHFKIKIQNHFDVTWIRFSCRMDQRCLHPLQACF